MNRKRVRRVGPPLAVVAGLLLSWWATQRVLSAWLTAGPQAGSAPVLVLPRTELDFGTVSQGTVLRTTFPISNTGGRRLIVVQQKGACCGQSPESRRLVVAPGDTEELTVEADTAPWHGRMDHVIDYTTNDPRLPRFNLRVTATVE